MLPTHRLRAWHTLPPPHLRLFHPVHPTRFLAKHAWSHHKKASHSRAPPASQGQIRKVRDASTQVDALGVPEEHLGGHAFHTYRLTSADGSVRFSFQHNVVERGIYAEGTVDAVLFLAKKMREGSAQKVFSMVDVLREGALR